jgi:hypothetical protein
LISFFGASVSEDQRGNLFIIFFFFFVFVTLPTTRRRDLRMGGGGVRQAVVSHTFLYRAHPEGGEEGDILAMLTLGPAKACRHDKK